MTAPDTNVEKQQRRHRPSLIGMSVAAAIVAIVFIALVMWPKPLVDGETGAELARPAAEDSQ